MIKTPTNTEQYNRIIAARSGLVLDHPFFGVLALNLRIVERRDLDTAATDGTHLFYNPTFTATLSHDVLKGLLAHEVLHCALGHPWRREGRDGRKWNIAADYAINDELIRSGFSLPSGILQCEAADKGKSAEWFFSRLPADRPQDEEQNDENDENENGESDESQNAPGDGDGENNGDGTPAPGMSDPFGGVMDAPAESAESGDQMSPAEWQQATIQAEQAANMAGTSTTGLDRLVDTITRARVDWRSILRRFLSEACKADYTWTRPSVRYLSAGLYLPSLHSQTIGKLAIAVDTSGSVDDVLLAQFSAEIQAIADEVQPTTIDVLYCDTEVHRVDSFDRGDIVTLTPCGGGGTDFRPVFEHIEQSGETPVALIYLTDLDGREPDTEPEYPVLWTCTTENIGSFGETVRIDE